MWLVWENDMLVSIGLKRICKRGQLRWSVVSAGVVVSSGQLSVGVVSGQLSVGVVSGQLSVEVVNGQLSVGVVSRQLSVGWSVVNYQLGWSVVCGMLYSDMISGGQLWLVIEVILKVVNGRQC